MNPKEPAMGVRESNPFYSNHVFNREDLNRAIFSKWNWVWLWLYPSYVQISEGYVFKYKIVNAEYWLISCKELQS